MMRMSNLACVDPIWKELYNRAICLGWRLFKFTIWDPGKFHVLPALHVALS